MKRVDLYNSYIEIKGTDGTVVRFQCDKLTALAAKGKDQKYRPSNGLENELSLGGPKSVDNVTLSKLYDETVDPHVLWLLGQAGRAKVVVTKQPIDENGHAFGTPLNAPGRLTDVTTPEQDSESEKPALIEFMCSLESTIA